jgi:hypothetical protein
MQTPVDLSKRTYAKDRLIMASRGVEIVPTVDDEIDFSSIHFKEDFLRMFRDSVFYVSSMQNKIGYCKMGYFRRVFQFITESEYH